MTEKQQLRAEYEKLAGKKCYHGWGEDQLKEKIEQLQGETAEEPKEKPPEKKESKEILNAKLEKLRLQLKDGDARAAVLALKDSDLPKDQLIQALATDPRVRKAGGEEIAKCVSVLSSL